MNLKTKALFYLLLIIVVSCGKKQEEAKDDMSFVVSSNISNYSVRCFAEDTIGHIWIGTDRGLNRYDGNHYMQYFSTEDTTSLTDNKINDIFIDSHHRMWVSTINGVCLYTDADCFRRIPIYYRDKRCTKMLEDHKGRLFLNTTSGLCRYNEGKGSFEPVIDYDGNRNNMANAFIIDRHDNLWLITSTELRKYDGKNFKKKFSIPLPSPFRFFYHGYVLVNGRKLWIAGEKGLSLFDVDTCKFQELPLRLRQSSIATDGTITCIHPRKGGLLFSSLSQGTFFLQANGNLLEPYKNFESFRFHTVCMFNDTKGNLWMGANDQGYRVMYRDYGQFNSLAFGYDFTSLKGQPIKSIAKDREGNLWIVSKTGGIVVYDAAKTMRQVALPDRQDADINKLFAASDGSIWIGTERSMLHCAFDGKVLHTVNAYTTPTINDIAEDRNGCVWAVGLTNNVLVFPKGSKDYRTIKMFTYPFALVTKITTLRDGSLLISAHNQAMRIVNPETKKATILELDTVDYVRCIKRGQYIPMDVLQDDSDNIYIGTVGNGLLKYTPLTGRLNPIEGLSCKDISSIEKDEKGNLWISTLNGLNKYEPSKNKVIQFFESDGIGGNQFLERSSCYVSDSLLLFGGTHGLTSFNPNKVTISRRIKVVFEYLKIHNRLVTPEEEGCCIKEAMQYNPTIHLAHNENSFSIGFSAIDMAENEQEKYAYILEGYDKDWVDAGSNHEAYYANLPAGHYTFRVRAMSNGNDEVVGDNAIAIVVKPVVWNTWWAWLCYILIACLLGLYIRRIQSKAKVEKMIAERAKYEKEQEQKENKSRMRFFANVSHEFRTPLTMIAGPVDMLCDSKAIQGNDKKLLNIVKYSSSRMLKLVNQLMDVSKVEDDALTLRVKRMDIMSLLRNIVESVNVSASMKEIRLTTEGLEGAYVMWLDADKLDKIMNNLLSNALKFTPEGGEIDVSFKINDNDVAISVADTGDGIPEGEREKVFERFYQMNNQTSKNYVMGTGIGLYYSRKLAKLHHGTLVAGNRNDGHGAAFTLTLPTADNVYANDDKFIEEGQEALYPVNDVVQPVQDAKYQGDKATILVVDDDADAVNYLQTLLSPYYNVVYRFNALKALEQMEEMEPKVILSDVTMPGMDGYEFCKKIKENPQLCHIPVILVTARTTVDNQVEGLQTGADAYITKPFAPKLLLAVIQSQIANRERIGNILKLSTKTDEDVEKELAPADAEFMEKLYKIMAENITDADLDVNRIAGQMGMSRSKFYYKVKGLTDTPPGTFFRTYKLNRAAELIRSGRYNISEVTFMTGFNSLSYFSTCFKKQFGMSPTDFH